MKRAIALVALMLALSFGTAFAASSGTRPVREQVEASMLVSGQIDIDPDGSVAGYHLDKADSLPAAVVELLGKNVPNWRFEPVLVDGTPARVRSRLSVRLRARKLDDERYRVEIAGAHFGAHDDADMPTSKRLVPPRYPRELALAGISGTVYLLLKVTRDGSVEDVMAEQTNLKTIANEHQMERMRERFERVAVDIARKRWTFNPPAKPGDAPYWTVRVPVEFIAPADSQPGPGQWDAYVPGPRQPNPWSLEDDAVAPDTLVAGGVYPVGRRGPQLLTPLDPSGG